ncbi:GerAB/ArcD/ProY family transporter [Priestia flexa]
MIISSKQFFIISIMFLVGDGILYVPTIVATSAKEDSWIVGIISIIETLLIVWGYARLANGMKISPYQTIWKRGWEMERKITSIVFYRVHTG